VQDTPPKIRSKSFHMRTPPPARVPTIETFARNFPSLFRIDELVQAQGGPSAD